MTPAQFLEGMDRLRRCEMAPLGDPKRLFAVELTEPEINGIYAFVAFVKSACVVEPFMRFWEHYGSTMQRLSDRLTVFDDSPSDAAKEPTQ
jgi:hypothetical protein